MHKSKLRRITLAVCFAFMPMAADAAGLGKLTVISGLGEPLNAEIELLSTTPEELSTLTAAIAPEEAYAVQGLERNSLHSAIQVEVGKKPDGAPILRLSTRQPVSDPFLDMLIQVDWATGRLLREYTVLLDPPGYSNNTATGGAAVNAPSVQSAAPSETTSPVEQGDTSGSPAAGQPSSGASSNTQAASQEEPSTPEQEYRTAEGDTLSAIARRTQMEGVSLEQMLAGLYNANEDAFVGGNMNRLKVGQIIRVPSSEELQSIPQTEAAQQVRVHSNDWNAYRNRLAGLVEDAAPAAEDTDSQTSGGRITGAAEDKSAPAAAGPRDVVKLSKSEAGAAAGDSKALQDRINSLQEEVIAKEKAAQEANERTAMLEKQIADMQKLLAIKNQSLAEMQSNASGAAAAPATPEQPADNAQEPAQATPAEEPPAAEPAQAAAAPEAPAAGATAPAAEPAAVPKKRVTPPPPPPIVEEPGILDGLTEDPMLLAAAGGGLVLLGGGWLFLRNRRRRNLDSFEQGILTAGGLKANTVFGNTAGGTVDTGDTSFLTDFSQSGGGMIDTHDVDPIAEAEVYMAYGRDAQAEEILKDAIAKEPQRYELHLKLLEIIANRKDTAAFETIAGELYSTLGSNDPTWLKVAALGQQLEPGNPLYDTKGAGSVSGAAAAVATGAAAAVAAETSRLDASDFENAEELSESSLDFSLGGDTNSPAQEPAAAADSGLDFDLGAASEPQEKPLSEMTTMSDSIFGTMEASPESSDQNLGLGLASLPAHDSMEMPEADFGNTVPGLEMPQLGEVEASAPSQDIEDAEPALELNESAQPADDMGLNFEMPELGVPGSAEVAPVHQAADEPPKFEQTLFMEAPVEAAEINDIGFESAADESSSLELPDLGEASSAGETVEEEQRQPADEGMDLDFNFDAELSTAGTSVSFDTSEDEEAPNPPEIDLSGISLDFGPTIDNPDLNNEGASPAISAETSLAEGESPEVETKLDLVTAYIEMGDKEGARELLDEVLKEGGPQQKSRAQEMLGNLA